MIIALDGIPLTLPKTGVGHYTFELARSLAQERSDQQIELVAPSNLPPIALSDHTPPNLRYTSVNVGLISRLWFAVGLPRYIQQTGIQLFHGTNYEIPLRHRCATVLTIHDLSLLVLSGKQQPRRVVRARVRLPIMARAADTVIVPTEAVKNEVCDRFKLAATKVFSVPEAAREFFQPAPAVEIDAVKTRFGISEAFVFAVGTIEPRKNYLMLIEAFENVLKTRPDLRLQLVIAGARGWASEQVVARIEASPARAQIILTGYLNDVHLRALYSSCTISAYPSQYEGFGLPPLEAMACGAPVIASNIPSVAEIVGNAARLVDPFDSDAWASNIIELAGNKEARASQRRAGFERVAQFSWQMAATKTYAVYQEAIARWRSNNR